MSAGGTTPRTLARRWATLLLGAAAFTAAYHLVLFGAMVVRFGNWPNYAVVYPLLDDYRLIVTGTPALGDAIPMLMEAPWLEAGYRNAEYFNIAEWSFLIMPATLLQVFLLGGLLTAFWLLYRRDTTCRSWPAQHAAVATGAGLTAVTGATLTSVACTTTPSWVVLLVLLGLSSGHALTLEIAGPWLRTSGLLLLFIGLAWALRDAARPGQHPSSLRPTREAQP